MYPYLGRFSDTKAQIDHIVLFTAKSTGTIVWINDRVRNDGIKLGEHRKVYEELLFGVFEGEIILNSE